MENEDYYRLLNHRNNEDDFPYLRRVRGASEFTMAQDKFRFPYLLVRDGEVAQHYTPTFAPAIRFVRDRKWLGSHDGTEDMRQVAVRRTSTAATGFGECCSRRRNSASRKQLQAGADNDMLTAQSIIPLGALFFLRQAQSEAPLAPTCPTMLRSRRSSCTRTAESVGARPRDSSVT
jgi:hypothetical protein